MEDWMIIVLAIFAIPLLAIGGGLAYAAMRMVLAHRAEMQALRSEERKRQAEIDGQILGLGGKESSAVLEVIEARLAAIEGRLDRLEGVPAGAPTPSETEQEPGRWIADEQAELA